MRILSPKLLKILTFYFGQNCAKIQFAYHPDPELLEIAFYITNNSEQCKSIFFKQKLIHFHFSMRMPLMYLFRWMAKKPGIALCIYFAISAQTQSQGEQIYEKKLLACWLVAITSSNSSSNFSKSFSHSSQFEGKWWGIRTLCLF